MSNYSNAIDMAIAGVFEQIPEKILNMTFRPNRGYRDMRRLPARIEDTIIREIVLPELNTRGGEEIYVHLRQAYRYQTDEGMVFEIPDTLTGGRRITAATHLRHNEAFLNSPMMGSSMLDMQAARAWNGLVPNRDLNQLPSAELIGPNTILMRSNWEFGDTVLRCQVDNDEYLANIKSSSWHKFRDLVVAATKRYIYNNISLDVGDGSMNGNSMDGRFRALIDRYESAQEEYTQALKVWERAKIMGNPLSNRERIFVQFGGR